MNVAAMRNREGITQEQLAQRVGVKRSTVAMWETDANAIPSNKLIEISKALKCSISDLFKDTNETA